MPEGSVVFSKIAATPTPTAWSQAYSAGKLFTVLSLKKAAEEEDSEENSLKAIGKTVLDALETEFFSLEEKNLESVKAAIETAVKSVPEAIELSFVTTVLSGNILYSYISGKGKIFIKRADKFGFVMQSLEDSRNISSASGFLQNSDLIILATEGFSSTVSKDQLVSSLDSLVPSEIAENLAPSIHESEEAGAAAIILSYKEDAAAVTEKEMEDSDAAIVENIQKEDKQYSDYLQGNTKRTNFLAPLVSIFASIGKIIPKSSGVSHSKKIYLTIAVLILIVLIASVLLGIKKQNDAKIKAAFEAVYPVAQKKYEEGKSLKDLNKSFSLDSFTAAKTLLEENKDTFSDNSEEDKQIESLLEDVNKELADSSPSKNATIDRSKLTITVENGSGVEGAAGKASTFLEDLGYKASTTANADNYDYEGVTIKVKAAAKDYLETLKKDLAEEYTITSATADLSAGSSTDAVVIIGK